MADKQEDVNEVLIRAKLSIDEALSGVVGQLSPAQLKRLRAQDDVNTSCTNTSCGKKLAEDISQPQ